MATTVWAILSATVGTVASNCTSCSRWLGSSLDPRRARNSLLALPLDLRRERDTPSAARASARLQLPVVDPVVDRDVADTETLRNIAHAQLAGSEGGRGRNPVGIAKPAYGFGVEAAACARHEARGIELDGELLVATLGTEARDEIDRLGPQRSNEQ